jgi:hypothetical protein
MKNENGKFINHPIDGLEVFKYFNDSKIPHLKNLYFLTNYGCFSCSMLNSNIDVSDENIHISAKFYFIYQDYLNNKYNLCKPLHMNIAPSLDHYHVMQKIIHIDGIINNKKTFNELNTFICNIFKVRICRFCDSIFVTDNPISDTLLCNGCLHLETNAKIIQSQVRQAFTNPERFLCRQRLLKEFQELVDEPLK